MVPAWPATSPPPGSGWWRQPAGRQDRRRAGKSGPLDAVSAARAARSGRARGAPRGRDGAVEAVRALMADGRSARCERTQASSQARALIVTGPEDLRARFAAHATADLVTDLASLRPRPGAVAGYHTRIALREPGRRAGFPDSQIACLDALIMPLVTGHAPGLLALHGAGTDTAALLLVAAGDHPGTAPLRSRLGPPVRRRPDPRLLRHDQTAPPQPRRRPAGQPRPAAHRDHPDELPLPDPRLRRPAHRRRPD
jgi:hypothetical protein